MTTVAVNTYTHSVTYVADNILKSIKDIIRLSGLDPSNLVNSWASKMRALQAWLSSQHLQTVVLEVYDPKTDNLVGRWDIDVIYTGGTGDGGFHTDTDQINYHIRKQGVIPSEAKYSLLLQNKAGYAAVEGWGSGAYRATDGFVRHNIGSTISHGGLGGNAAYWRKA